MKKRIFQDSFQIKTPRIIWKFLLISVFFHCLLGYALLVISLVPKTKSESQYTPNLTAPSPREPVGIPEGDAPVETVATEEAIAPGEVNPKGGLTEYSYPVHRRSVDIVDTDEYIKLYRKPFQYTMELPSSSFSLKIGTLSYPRVRRSIKKRQLPTEEVVKIEEMINYFHYNYPQPTGEHPISITTELAACPWHPSNRLLHIGLKGRIVFNDGLKDSQFTIAENVIIRVTFNPGKVRAYRLIGYGSRTPKVGLWSHEIRGTGEMRAGQRITSLYEIIPLVPGTGNEFRDQETATVMVCYRNPGELIIKRINHLVLEMNDKNQEPTENFRFSVAVAQFGMLLKNSEFKGKLSLPKLIKLAKDAMGEDRYRYRAQFIKLLKTYQSLIEKKQEK